ncbi:NAD(P)-dependent oxidoreductase [Flavobacterium luteolum]|uniref:NAD(P)-dependent oxidoreductase n=1 Tax=Flavobacterium luteolum TaxID=3003259 RepID=UPI00248E2178|nr:NAD(P)-dependent oxidoreductase [Flavobacterium luteolum]
MTIGKKKLLITESNNFSKNALTTLNDFFQVKQGRIESRDELKIEIADSDIIFVRLGFVIDKEIIEKAPNLKFILSATTGLDHIDVTYFESIGGKVISLRNEVDFLKSIPSTAEHTWALLLALLKKIPSSFDHVKKGEWNRNLYINTNLKCKKIGILGLGRVGMQVANFAKTFDMEVGFFDVKDIESQFNKFKTSQELFAWADIISIHIPYTETNKNFVNKELLSYLKSNSVIINTSRGGIWDEEEVAFLIEKGIISGVATDVLKNELNLKSISSNPLVLLANQDFNVIITPHVAGASKESMEMTEEFIVQKFLDQI